MSVSRAVLITGCSTGIGRATALHLHRSGLPVYTTARRSEPLEAGHTIAGRFAVSPEKIAIAIERAVTARQPRPRYVTGMLGRAR